MSSTLKIITAAVLMAVFAGRAEAQTQLQSIGQSNIQCISTVFNSPEAAPLLAHVPFRVQDASAAQLADATVPTVQEAAAIRLLYPRIQNCQSQTTAQISIYLPTIANIFSRSYSDTAGDVALLENRQMTWGMFTTRRRDRAVAYLAMAENEARRLVAQVQQQQAAVQQQQQAAAAGNFIMGLAKLALGVAVVSAASRPVVYPPHVTTCNTMGYSTTCFGN